jgi:DnaB-like helicase C terminal domain
MSLYDNLLTEINKGLEGKNGSIPFPVAKLDEYIDIAKNTNYLLVGDTGGGKSTIAQDLILNTLDWYYLNKSEDIKLSIIYFGMERKQYNYSAKWVSRMIFLEEGIYIPTNKILGRMRKRDGFGKLTAEYDLLTEKEVEKIKFYAKKFDLWEQDNTFICIEGTHNPMGIKIFIDNFAKENGTIIAKEEGPLSKPTYIPNHPNHIVLIVTDYVGILDKEKGDDGVKKNRLDLYSAYMRRARDLYRFSPVNIQQLSRQVGDSSRLKLNDVKPRLTDIADTSELARDADVVIAIFEPYRYLPQDTETDLIGYNLHQLKDNKGNKFYRSLHILKNSFSSDGIVLGCAFHPMTGIIKPMMKPPNLMTPNDYEDIITGKYFLK